MRIGAGGSHGFREPESSMNPIVALTNHLRTLHELLGELGDDVYRTPAHPFGSGIGAHLRHSLDHVRALLDGWQADVVRYDVRERGTTVESERTAGIETLKALEERLQTLKESDLEESVQVEQVISADGAASVVASTLGRELIFVLHHAAHHDALIAAQLRLQNVQVDSQFGLSPATRAFLGVRES